MIQYDHLLPCGHRVTTFGVDSSPALVEATRRHSRMCAPVETVYSRQAPPLIRRFLDGECGLGHRQTRENTYVDELARTWCRDCSQLAQNGVIQ